MTNPSDGDYALEQRLRAGDETALAELFGRHRERLWRMVQFRLDRRLLGRLDPEDVLQESFLAARGRLTHFQGREQMSAFVWLRLIVLQTLVDTHRHHLGAQVRDAEREQSLGHVCGLQTTTAALAVQLAGDLTSPSQAAAREETYHLLDQAIAAMEPIDREVLALRHFEELTNSEVAEVLQIQQKAASIRYMRAVRRLKEILRQIPGFQEERYDG